MSLKDLEEIQHEVIEPSSRTLLREVVKCYEAGAYRAALVSLWIAVVSDLTCKIRRLAESGDGEAKIVIDTLDLAIERHNVKKVQKYEREIIATAADKLQILDLRSKEELDRLNKDRNLCAHPGYVDRSELFQPDAELVRSHLVVASRSCFSQPPLVGKRLLAILETELRSDSWPNDGEYFLDRFFRPARTAVKRNLVKLLIKYSLRAPDQDDDVMARSLVSTLAVSRECESVFEYALQSVLSTWEASGSLGDAELVRAVGAYGAVSLFWLVFPRTGKSRLEALLKRHNVDRLIDNGLFVGRFPSDDSIASKCRMVISRMDGAQVNDAIQQSECRHEFVSRAIELVGESGSFRSAEYNLRLLERCCRNVVLECEDVRNLREAIEGNPYQQVRQANGVEEILISIYSEQSPDAAARDEWCALAKWLNDQGREKGDGYLYERFMNLLEVDG